MPLATMTSARQQRVLEVQALEAAKSQRRHRCWAETTYDHTNLADWIGAVLPSWEVVTPPAFHRILGPVLPASSFPENTEATRAALRSLLNLPTDAAADDLINGHCEQCAHALATAVMARASGGCTGRDALDAGTMDLSQGLRGESVDAQLARLFAAHLNVDASTSYSQQQRDWWRPLLRVAEGAWPTAELDPEAALCAGTTSAANSLAAAASACEATCADAGVGVAAIPIYVLCYLFDADELEDADLATAALGDDESACFSVHVIAAVLHAAERTVLLCDPNGQLKPESGMELLRLPVARLPAHVAPSTANSRRDRDAKPMRPKRKERATE